MKKFLDCDWLRKMQFLVNTVQKKGNLIALTLGARAIFFICSSPIELPFSRYKAESGAKWAHYPLRRPRYLNAWKRLESNISDKTENKDFNVKILRVSLVD